MNMLSLIIKLEQYNHHCIHFCESIKNKVMNEGNFIRVLYSTEQFTLNGIYLLLPFKEVYIEKYYNKYKCSFNVYQHKHLIEKIAEIENTLLNKIHTIQKEEAEEVSIETEKKESTVFFNHFHIVEKEPQYKIQDQIKNGTIKIFSDDYPSVKSNLFVLKISGIWETDTQYGLTYKFSKVVNNP